MHEAQHAMVSDWWFSARVHSELGIKVGMVDREMLHERKAAEGSLLVYRT